MKRLLTTLAIAMCFVGGVYAQYNERMSELNYRLNHIDDFKYKKVSDSVSSPIKVTERPLSAKETVSVSKTKKKWNYLDTFKYCNTKDFSLGMGATCIGYNTEYREDVTVGISANILVCGVYADFDIKVPSHKTSVEVDRWEDEHKAFGWHVGYQIPIAKRFRIIPIVGHVKSVTGDVDGYDWHVGHSGVVNKFNENDVIVDDFDFGGVAVINFKYVNLNLKATRHTLGATLAFDVNFFDFDY